MHAKTMKTKMNELNYLQNYLREQPDNITSVNLVMESTKLLSTLYTHVDATNIHLICEILCTLSEMCVVSIHSLLSICLN